MNQTQLNTELKKYEESFKLFVESYILPSEWFGIADHVAIKCANRVDYISICKYLVNKTQNGIWEIELNARLLASAELATPLRIGEHEFSWIEVMQPRPGKETGIRFVEHTEFYFRDFTAVEDVLRQKKIAYELQENPGHRWINIPIDDDGREIKINDKVLADVVKWELEEGHLHKRDDL